MSPCVVCCTPPNSSRCRRCACRTGVDDPVYFIWRRPCPRLLHHHHHPAAAASSLFASRDVQLRRASNLASKAPHLARQMLPVAARSEQTMKQGSLAANLCRRASFGCRTSYGDVPCGDGGSSLLCSYSPNLNPNDPDPDVDDFIATQVTRSGQSTMPNVVVVFIHIACVRFAHQTRVQHPTVLAPWTCGNSRGRHQARKKK